MAAFHKTFEQVPIYIDCAHTPANVSGRRLDHDGVVPGTDRDRAAGGRRGEAVGKAALLGAAVPQDGPRRVPPLEDVGGVLADEADGAEALVLLEIELLGDDQAPLVVLRRYVGRRYLRVQFPRI